MDAKNYIKDLRDVLLSSNEIVGELEYTFGNYDNKGDLITNSIPTVTTGACEIGIYDDTIYFTFIILTSDFRRELFDYLTKYNNVQIYPFKDFNNTLYPRSDFNYPEFEHQLKQDEYLQINFNDNYKERSVEENMKKYWEYRDIFLKLNIKPINQLKSDNID
ncbi:hypothetical protein KJ836_03920 [Patescibacteria group bacterium]|nr:hypothetical protein [Patescibacteria group bacterium]